MGPGLTPAEGLLGRWSQDVHHRRAGNRVWSGRFGGLVVYGFVYWIATLF